MIQFLTRIHINFIGSIMFEKQLNQAQKEWFARSNKKSIDSCAINNAERAELRKQIMFLEEKYEKIKKKMYQKKLLDQLQDQDVQQIGNLMNIIAMKYSQDGQNKIAEDWLRRTLKYCDISQRLRIVTFNNMACVYKQSNDLPMALMYINKAQKQADYFCIEMKDDKLITIITDCSLNLCAILSAMGDHYKALKAARKALYLLKSSENLPNTYFQSLFPIMKYNQAVELERLKMYDQAQTAYKEAQQSPLVTEQLSERLCKAIEEVGYLKQKLKRKNKVIGNKGKRIRLSLPKFGPSVLEENTKPSQKTGRKSHIASQFECENEKNYLSIQPRERMKMCKIKIQDYQSCQPSARTTARTNKKVLASVQNF